MRLTSESYERLKERGYRFFLREDPRIPIMISLGVPLLQPSWGDQVVAAPSWTSTVAEALRGDGGTYNRPIFERVVRVGLKQEDPEIFASAFLAALEVGGEEGAMSYLDSVGS